MNLDFDTIYNLSKPVGTIIALLGSLAAAAWYVVKKIRLLKRDEELNDDYANLKLTHDTLQARYNVMLNRAFTLETNVRLLASCLVSLTSTMDAMANIIPTLVIDNAQNKPFLTLVLNLVSSANLMKKQAEEAISAANKEIEFIRDQAKQQQESYDQIQQQIAVRRESSEE
jgi:hypothetical protein